MRNHAVSLTLAAVLAVSLLPLRLAAGEPDAHAFPELEKLLSDPFGMAAVADEPPTPRDLARLSVDDIYPEIRVRVTSLRHTILSSQVTGRVDTVTARDGDRFAAGQVLVEIDPTFEKLALARAEANLHRQELLFEMTKELVDLQTKGELELELVRTDIRQASAEVDLIKTRLERTRVSVPFSGRVGDVAVREFQTVTEGQPLLEVIDDSLMELEFIVSSAWLRWFTPGFDFSVRIDELGKTFPARLVRIGGKVDPLSRSVKAYARLLESDAGLMEGMSGEAFIAPPEGEAP